MSSPASPSASMSSPASPSASMSSPASPSASVSSPASPSASVSSPASPSASVSSPASPSTIGPPVNVCCFCIPSKTLATAGSREQHERQHHAHEKGFYTTPIRQDRSETGQLFKKYLPILPNGLTTQETPLGIYLRNDKEQIVGAFHIVVCSKSVSFAESSKVRVRHHLFPGSGYAQGHIIPASSARDDASMLELSYDNINFEPLNPNINSNVGGSIEAYCQKLCHDFKWKVCVFVLLDKNNTLGTITATNGETYTISGRWSYLIFMERENENFYEAFSFPNGEPTKTYWGYRTNIAEIRSISGMDFQFEMSESLGQYWQRINQEKYERENPFVCKFSHLGCFKRFPARERQLEHHRYHNPKRQQQKKETEAKRRLAARTSVTRSSTTPDNDVNDIA